MTLSRQFTDSVRREPDAILVDFDLLRDTDFHADLRIDLHPSIIGTQVKPLAFIVRIRRFIVINCINIGYIRNNIVSIDEIDKSILRDLQRDGRTSNVKLAEAVGLSEAACLRRVRALEASDLITGYTALVNSARLGLPGNVFVEITLHQEQQQDLEAFERAVRGVPEVMECYLMTGQYDYLLRVVVKDLEDFERIHRESITRLPGVSRVQTSFALRTVTKRTSLPVR